MDAHQHRLQNIVGWGVGLTLMGFLAYPVGRWLVGQWLTNEYYSHGVLVLLVSVYLTWRAMHRNRAVSAPANAALVFLGCGAGLYLVGEAWAARYLAAVALILMAGGVIGFLSGWEALRQLAFPLAYLAFAVPFPFVDSLAVTMGSLTAGWATALVRGFGVAAANEGGRVILPSCSLVVGAPCSGVRSLVALLALAAVWVYLVRGPWSRRMALLAAAVPLAGLTNLLRITSLLWVADRWGVETAQRYYHDFSGLIFFALALAGLLGLSWGAGCRDLRSDI
jgi:exosortase